MSEAMAEALKVMVKQDQEVDSVAHLAKGRAEGDALEEPMAENMEGGGKVMVL